MKVDFSIETPGCPSILSKIPRGRTLEFTVWGLTGHSAQSCQLPGEVAGNALMAPTVTMHVSLIEHKGSDEKQYFKTSKIIM